MSENKCGLVAQSNSPNSIRGSGVVNPTLRENIDNRIQHFKDEIVRLEKVKEQMPQMLDINLRDLREAMNF